MMEEMLKNLTSEQAELFSLILASQGIPSRIVTEGEMKCLKVEDALLQKAADIIQAYCEENATPLSNAGYGLQNHPMKPWSVIAMIVILIGIHLAGYRFAIHKQMILSYGASALFILQGEYFRTVTALMLHADFQHLLGNCAGILVFGIPVCSIAGSGLGTLLILLSGVSGNLINAVMVGTARLSIGASTSVMGAAGILVAFQVKQRYRLSRISASLFYPIGAGIALMGMLSGGENTDISAHLFGFLSGLMLGGFLRLPKDTQNPGQAWWMSAAVILVLAGWLKLL